MIKLSILILTVPNRIKSYFPNLINLLMDQLENRDDVEILGLFDNKKRSVGEKRQNLIDIANGKYMCFIDDDDRVSDNYITELVKVIDTNPDVDCILFDSIITQNKSINLRGTYSIKYNHHQVGNLIYAKPCHVHVIRTELVKKHRFKDLSHGEDSDWVKRVCNDIKNEVILDNVFYYYDYFSNVSETSGVNAKTTVKGTGKIIKEPITDPIIEPSNKNIKIDDNNTKYLSKDITKELIINDNKISLISYIIKAYKPFILVLNNSNNIKIKDLLELIQINNLNVNYQTQKVIYDIIICNNFDNNLYEYNLNYDGIYIFTDKFETMNNFEVIKYHDYFLIKKSDFTPYCLLEKNKINIFNNYNPIILRNYQKFNIIPYKEPFEIINDTDIIIDLCKKNSIKNCIGLKLNNSPLFESLKHIIQNIIQINNIKTYLAENNKKKFDLIIINASNDFESLQYEFNGCLNIINDQGMIIIRNTYPVTIQMTNKNLCSDCYKIVDFIKNNYKSLHLFNIPISPGLCIIKNNDGCNWSELINKKTTTFDNNIINLNKYSIMICVKEQNMAIPVLDSLKPLKADVLIGAGYPSFSKLVNDAIIKSSDEIVIFCSHRVRPKPSEVDKIISLLKQGYGLVGLYRFAFFGFTKELIRRIGFFDETFLLGGWEDDDFVVRLLEADIAYYEEESIIYNMGPTTWSHTLTPQIFKNKWDITNNTITRKINEPKYDYNIGLLNNKKNSELFLPWNKSVILRNRVASKYFNYNFKK